MGVGGGGSLPCSNVAWLVSVLRDFLPGHDLLTQEYAQKDLMVPVGFNRLP